MNVCWPEVEVQATTTETTQWRWNSQTSDFEIERNERFWTKWRTKNTFLDICTFCGAQKSTLWTFWSISIRNDETFFPFLSFVKKWKVLKSGYTEEASEFSYSSCSLRKTTKHAPVVVQQKLTGLNFNR